MTSSPKARFAHMCVCMASVASAQAAIRPASATATRTRGLKTMTGHAAIKRLACHAKLRRRLGNVEIVTAERLLDNVFFGAFEIEPPVGRRGRSAIRQFEICGSDGGPVGGDD